MQPFKYSRDTDTASVDLSSQSSDCPIKDALRNRTPLTQDIYLDAVHLNGLDLCNVPALHRNPSVLLGAVRQNAMALQFFNEADFHPSRTNPAYDTHADLAFATDIALSAVSQNGLSIQFLDDAQRTPDILLAAAKQDGYSLRIIPKRLRSRAINIAAVEQDGWSIQFLTPEEIDHDIRLAAVQQSGYAIKFIEPTDRAPDLCLAAMLNAFAACRSLTTREYAQPGSAKLHELLQNNWDHFTHIVGKNRSADVKQAILSTNPLFTTSGNKASKPGDTAVAHPHLFELRILPGMSLQMRKHSSDSLKRHVQFIGSVHGKGIMIAPRHSEPIFSPDADELYVFQGFTGKHAFSFSARAIQTFDKPIAYTLIEYPQRVDSELIRQEVRHKASCPAFVILPDENQPDLIREHNVTLHDLSLNGAKVVSEKSFGLVGDTITLHIAEKVHDEAINIYLHADIRHISNLGIDNLTHTGLRFRETTLQDKLLISYLQNR